MSINMGQALAAILSVFAVAGGVYGATEYVEERVNSAKSFMLVELEQQRLDSKEQFLNYESQDIVEELNRFDEKSKYEQLNDWEKRRQQYLQQRQDRIYQQLNTIEQQKQQLRVK